MAEFEYDPNYPAYDEYDDQNSMSDAPLDYTEIIEKDAFKGDMPFDVIKECILNQFQNYIHLDDTTNYVEIFYNQLHQSYEAMEDEEEIHKEEIREVLNDILSQFYAFMHKEFESRLTLTLMDIENEEVNQDDIEYAITAAYNYFILNARNNFLNVIYKDIKQKIRTVIADDKEYFRIVRDMLSEYSPFVLAVGPMEFIRLSPDEDIINLFQSGRLSGNFLRKYSPKLYDNEDLEVEIINRITMAQEIRRDLIDGSK